jgi:hypothetical protein
MIGIFIHTWVGSLVTSITNNFFGGDNWDIYGRRHDRTGSIIGRRRSIAYEDDNHRSGPDVVQSSYADEYLVVFEYE